MSSPEVYAVIMAGGSGTRFWPASRPSRPKQFLPITGGRPMITETVERLDGLVPMERVLVVTAESQRELVHEALPGLPPENVLAEPCAKNTGPCVAWAAYEVAARNPAAVQVVLPADHVIQPEEAFQRTLGAAVAEAAEADFLVTFGIVPAYPATGYGYIEAGDRGADRNGIAVHAVARFVEKPDLPTAERFLSEGTYLWNSGMFVWRTDVIMAALREHLPAVCQELDRLAGGADLGEVYGRLPSVSVDVGVLEKATNVRMLPIDYRWSDVGSWAALPEVLEADAAGNVAAIPANALLVAEDAQDCVAYAEDDEVIALVGVKGLIVVRAGKRTLVCPRDRAQDVRRVVARLEAEGKHFL
jgi:mannose-1-phosphate guanylyltransferase